MSSMFGGFDDPFGNFGFHTRRPAIEQGASRAHHLNNRQVAPHGMFGSMFGDVFSSMNSMMANMHQSFVSTSRWYSIEHSILSNLGYNMLFACYTCMYKPKFWQLENVIWPTTVHFSWSQRICNKKNNFKNNEDSGQALINLQYYDKWEVLILKCGIKCRG